MSDPSLTIVQKIAAPPDRVYAAWLSPDLLERWWRPGNGPVTSVEVEPRVGGALRIVFLNDDGSRHVSEGTFLELKPDECLRFEMRSMSDATMTEVIAMFRATDAGTELTVTQTQFTTSADRDFHAEGWAGALAKLVALFSFDVERRDTMSSDQAVIKDQLERWAASVRARDMAGILASHSPDIRLFNVPKPAEQRGLREYEKALRLYLDNAPDDPPYRLSDIEITSSNAVAFASMLLHCHGGGDTESDSLLVRVTIGLVKEDGAWVITHEHHSTPITFEPSQ